MTIEPNATKRFTFIAWCSATALFLFFFSVSISAYESLFGVIEFVTWAIVLFGGGVSYHVAYALFVCPQDESNYKYWSNLLKHLMKVHLGYAIAGVIPPFITVVLSREFKLHSVS